MTRTYDNTLRQLRAAIRDAKLTAERARKRPYEKRYASKKERRAAQRARSLPADRRCPLCKEVKLKSRQWADGICLSCHRRGYRL